MRGYYIFLYFMIKDEYEELLKYAVVVPTYDPRQLPKTLSDFRGTFPGFDSRSMQRQEQVKLCNF